ncbi:MAG: S8 family serine peptidase [Bacteroidota bacterium]
MNRKLPLMFTLITLCISMTSAQISTKLDLRLWEQMQAGSRNEQKISLLVKGDINKVKELVKRYKGNYKYGYQNISSVEIHSKYLLVFTEDNAIEKVENTSAKGTFLMDTARIRNNIDSVHTGFSPLPNNLKGRNVVMGIIDGGIYWQHKDFKKPNGETRIRYIWDQVVTSGSNSPAPYNYGNQWSWIDIDNGNCTHTPPSNDFGHGTSVAGAAAGNSRSTEGTIYENQYTGAAPESEIIAVRVSYSGNFLANVADAVDYIFKKADALGKPCVINTSIGTYYGSHDGVDLGTQLIETLLDQRNGRVLVAAAGNGGSIPHHLSYNIPADSAYTFFKYNSTYREVYFDFWADTSNFNNARFAIGCNDTLGNDLRRTQYFSVPADFNPPSGSSIVRTIYLVANPKFDTISIAATLDEGRYHVEVLIHPARTFNYWRLQTSGSGKFDLWSSAELIGSADMTSYLRSGVYIQYPGYKHPDTLKTMVSSWQNSEKVITVGNYSNRAGYIDYNSNYVDLTAVGYDEVPGQKVLESSFGPTRDNRLKPDIMATGHTILATGDANNIALLLGSNQGYKVAPTGKHSRNGGTSMASPIVAGIAALYMEKRPTATYDEIKQAIICTAKRDSFTGNAPNIAYGNGKADAFAALTAPASCFVFGAKDTACINYNELANADTGGCVAKIYGCMDSTAANYNVFANIENGTCVFTSIRNITANDLSVRVVPNPFSSRTAFSISGATFDKGVIKIFNQLGALADEIPLSKGITEYTYQNHTLSKGVYSYVLSGDDQYFSTGKLVVD